MAALLHTCLHSFHAAPSYLPAYTYCAIPLKKIGCMVGPPIFIHLLFRNLSAPNAHYIMPLLQNSHQLLHTPHLVSRSLFSCHYSITTTPEHLPHAHHTIPPGRLLGYRSISPILSHAVYLTLVGRTHTRDAAAHHWDITLSWDATYLSPLSLRKQNVPLRRTPTRLQGALQLSNPTSPLARCLAAVPRGP